MRPALRASRFPVEVGLLLGLCLFLPVHEFWKNATWLAYVVCWLVNRTRARDFGGPWGRWDSLIFLWLASGFAVAAFAGIPGGEEWPAALDVVRYASVLWLVKRAGYGEREIRWVLIALLASSVLGLGIGYGRIWTGASEHGWLELPSVGHVNHTAIYLAILLGLCVALLFARWPQWRRAQRVVGLAVTAFVLASLVMTASRGAIGAGLAMIPVIAAFWWPRWRTPFAASLAAVAVVVGASYVLELEVVRKHEKNVSSENVLAFRDGIWRMGMEGWKRFPIFGVGMDN
jgi:O-antigen ligase